MKMFTLQICDYYIITFKSKVVIESSLTVRKSCKLVNVSVSPFMKHAFNQEDSFCA